MPNCPKETFDFGQDRITPLSIDDLMTGLLNKFDGAVEGLRLTIKELLIFYRHQTILHYFPDDQPSHICKEEGEEILALKKEHDFSIGGLSFIFQRSKSSIHDILKKNNITESEE